jgi:hypothetical protein
MSTASIWSPGSNNIPVANPASQLMQQEFVAVTGQTLFNITAFSYNVGFNALDVYVNGVKYPKSEVTETSETSFTLSTPCDAGDIVEALGNTGIGEGTVVNLNANSVVTIQSGTGALSRTVETELREQLKVTQFSGSDPTGVSNSFTAVTNAITAASGRLVRFPSGTFNLTFSGSIGFAPLLGTLVIGDGMHNTVLNMTPPNSASYPIGFDMSAGKIIVRGLTINYLTPSGGTGILIKPGSDLRFEDVKLDGMCTNVSAVISHENHCISIPSSGTVNDVEFINCDFTRWRFVILKANASTCTNRRWSLAHCDSYGNYNEDFAFNSPNGVFDDVQVYACRLRDGAGVSASINHLHASFASITNFRVSMCSFEGEVGDAIHIEENCINWTVTGNTINVDGTGVFLVDNNIAGSYTMPQQGVISGNTISKSGTLKEAGKHGVWIASGGGASTVSLKRATVSGNAIVGFEFGMYCDSSLDDTTIVTGNVSENCGYGFRATFPNSCFKGNASSNCTIGVFSENGGSFQDHIFIECATSAATGTTRPVVLFNPTFQFTEFSVGAGASVFKPCVALLTNARAYGHMHISEWCEVAADTSTESLEVTWDGTTFTATQKVSYEPGAVTCSAIRNSGNLAVQTFAASARTTVRVEAKFNGMLSVVSS